MEDRKRRSSPLGDGSDGREAQKRKLSLLSGPTPAEEDSNGAQLDAALGLEDGFLEVSTCLYGLTTPAGAYLSIT